MLVCSFALRVPTSGNSISYLLSVFVMVQVFWSSPSIVPMPFGAQSPEKVTIKSPAGLFSVNPNVPCPNVTSVPPARPFS